MSEIHNEPTVEEMKMKLMEEINEWANDRAAHGNFTLSNMVPHIEAYATRKFGERVTLINPRMVRDTLLADGFRLERPIEQVIITFSLDKGGEAEK